MKRIGGRGYRPDIDGLRAIAVLSVVFFHVGFTPFGGGYVGVDVFFVISGFLITRLICSEIQNGTFRFANFYVRRARRLFPALFFTLVVSLMFGAILFSPADLFRLARSVIFTVLSVSNFLFWRESGYFDASADVKPLLHTWSLSVEEQFYMIWPATLVGLIWLGHRLLSSQLGRGSGSIMPMMVRATARGIVPAFLLVTGLISLILTEICLEFDAAAAFFLAPFRITEFAIGGLMVWLVAYQPRHSLVLEPLVVLGLALIAYPVFAYSSETVFPGIAALPPCIGTAILIYSGTAKTLGGLLRNRVTVGIGLISYSLYLVHWPMIVFYKYWVFRPLDATDQVVIVLASVALATVMYFVVEMPFRRAASKPDAWSAATFGLVCAGLAVALIIPAANAWATSGWPTRLPQEIREAVSDPQQKRLESLENIDRLRSKTQFAKDKIKILVIGDSHAKDFSNALLHINADLGDKLDIIVRSVHYRCQPFVGNREISQGFSKRDNRKCNRKVRDILRSRLLESADYIIFSVKWTTVGVSNIDATINAILKTSDAKIVVLGPAAEFDDIPTLLVKFGRKDGFERLLQSFRSDKTALNEALLEISEHRGTMFLPKEQLVCPNSEFCHAFDGNGKILFYDYEHWTQEGAAFFANRMIETNYLDFLSR